MNAPVLKLLESDHEFGIEAVPPYSATINYEDGTSETFSVTLVDGSVVVTEVE